MDVGITWIRIQQKTTTSTPKQENDVDIEKNRDIRQQSLKQTKWIMWMYPLLYVGPHDTLFHGFRDQCHNSWLRWKGSKGEEADQETGPINVGPINDWAQTPLFHYYRQTKLEWQFISQLFLRSDKVNLIHFRFHFSIILVCSRTK